MVHVCDSPSTLISPTIFLKSSVQHSACRDVSTLTDADGRGVVFDNNREENLFLVQSPVRRHDNNGKIKDRALRQGTE